MYTTLVALLLATAPSSEEQGLRQELQATYDALASACIRQDLPAVMAMMAPDVRWTLADGSKLDRAGVEASMRDFLKTLEPGSAAKYSIQSVQRRADGVSVDVHLTVTTVQADPDHPGKRVKHVGHSGWHDVWTKAPSGWLNASGEEYELPSKKP